MYFLACGTSRSLGISVSKLKRLSEERLTETRKIAKTKAFMLIWDNFNNEESEQTVDLSSSLAHKTFSQAGRKLNAFKLANFGTSKTFYMTLSPRGSPGASHDLSCYRHLFNKFRSIKLNNTHYLLRISTSHASRERWVS